MTLLDPAQRSQRGLDTQKRLLGDDSPAEVTLFDQSWRDFIFAEVWSRPGLDRRSRFWIAIAGAAISNEAPAMLDGYVRGALGLGEVEVAELREAALHLAVYAGWSAGRQIDDATTRVVRALDLQDEAPQPLRAEPWDPQQRLTDGAAAFQAVMVYPGPPPVVPYFESGILNFVFGEMWMRPGLDQRSRRWITLVGVAQSSTNIPVNSHVYAAMASGNASIDEMHEFVLQYALYGGWPRASDVQAAVYKQGPRVAAGQPFQP